MRSILVALAASALLAACNPAGVAASVDAAKSDGVEAVGDNTYHNASFGITATAPDGWYVPDNELTRKIAESGSEIITADQKGATKAAMDASAARTVTIFSFMKHAPGSPEFDGAGVAALAEDVSVLPGIQRGTDYFFHAKKALEMGSVTFEETAPYSTHKIGGHDFDRMDIKLTVMGRTAMQRYLAARRGSYMVVFIQSYSNEADIPTLDKVLENIKLDW